MVLWKNDKIATGKNTTWAETEIWPRAQGKLLTSGQRLDLECWRGAGAGWAWSNLALGRPVAGAPDEEGRGQRRCGPRSGTGVRSRQGRPPPVRSRSRGRRRWRPAAGLRDGATADLDDAVNDAAAQSGEDGRRGAGSGRWQEVAPVRSGGRDEVPGGTWTACKSPERLGEEER